jgi:DNA-directed RNA polymerase subunit RPC12/RpoP
MDCVNCGMILPIEINHTHDDSESLACSYCGERYRGIYRPESAPASAQNVIRYG